jgi:hypothetical protein
VAPACRRTSSCTPELRSLRDRPCGQSRPRPLGDTGRHAPRHIETIVAAELEYALDTSIRYAASRSSSRGGARRSSSTPTASPATRSAWSAIARKRRDALPGGDEALRAAVWAFVRAILSPPLTPPSKDAFVHDSGIESNVDLEAHRSDSDLAELELDDESADAA